MIFLLSRIKLNKNTTSNFNDTCKIWKTASEQNDNILKLFDFFVEDDAGNLVLENYSFFTLADLISKRKKDKKPFSEIVLFYFSFYQFFYIYIY
jgi:serine/threonine protein kinase